MIPQSWICATLECTKSGDNRLGYSNPNKPTNWEFRRIAWKGMTWGKWDHTILFMVRIDSRSWSKFLIHRLGCLRIEWPLVHENMNILEESDKTLKIGPALVNISSCHVCIWIGRSTNTENWCIMLIYHENIYYSSNNVNSPVDINPSGTVGSWNVSHWSTWMWFFLNAYLTQIPIGSMVLLYMVTWIPSIYPQ